MSEELTTTQKAAAFHGLATNRATPLADRLQLALQALEVLADYLGDVGPGVRGDAGSPM